MLEYNTDMMKSINKKIFYYRYKKMLDKNYKELDLTAEEVSFLLNLSANGCLEERNENH